MVWLRGTGFDTHFSARLERIDTERCVRNHYVAD